MNHFLEQLSSSGIGYIMRPAGVLIMLALVVYAAQFRRYRWVSVALISTLFVLVVCVQSGVVGFNERILHPFERSLASVVSSTTFPVHRNDWQTFTDERYGISFQYPPGTELSIREGMHDTDTRLLVMVDNVPLAHEGTTLRSKAMTIIAQPRTVGSCAEESEADRSVSFDLEDVDSSLYFSELPSFTNSDKYYTLHDWGYIDHVPFLRTAEAIAGTQSAGVIIEHTGTYGAYCYTIDFDLYADKYSELPMFNTTLEMDAFNDILTTVRFL